MAYVKISWPDSQKLNKLTDEEVEEYEGQEIMVFGPDASWLIDEDYVEEILDICNERYYR